MSLPSQVTFVLDPVSRDSKVFDFVVDNCHLEISCVSDFEPLLIDKYCSREDFETVTLLFIPISALYVI